MSAVQLQLATCIADPECLENLGCLQLCNGRKDEAGCQVPILSTSTSCMVLPFLVLTPFSMHALLALTDDDSPTTHAVSSAECFQLLQLSLLQGVHVIDLSFHQNCTPECSLKPCCGVHRIDITCCPKCQLPEGFA